MHQSHFEALSLSQQTAQHLGKYGSTNIPIQLPFISHVETTEMWTMYETFLISCLRTGDDQAAHQCLEKLIERFGATNERVMGLQGIYQEAVAEDRSALEKILKEYVDVLAEDPVNTPVMKRRTALLRHLSRTNEAVDALIGLLEASPTDIEAWAELSELYQSQGLFSQAEFCLEEVILVAPNAWNIHARLGEVLFRSAANATDSDVSKILAESIRRFCRSVELCDGYLRGYYGLKLASDRLLVVLSKNLKAPASNPDAAENTIPSAQMLKQLNKKATSILVEITRRPHSDGYSSNEVLAAKKLLTESSESK